MPSVRSYLIRRLLFLRQQFTTIIHFPQALRRTLLHLQTIHSFAARTVPRFGKTRREIDMKTFTALLFAMVTSLAFVGPASALDEDGANSLVKLSGAIGDGFTDDTLSFQQAFAKAAAGGYVVIPEGHFKLTGTIVITKPVIIVGKGFSTQIFITNNQTMFQFVNVNNSAIRDVYLGSDSTTGHLIEFVNSHHNQINNVTMLGGNYGLHLKGSLLNTIIDLRSGTNFQGFFAPTSTNNVWVYAEPYGGISANANTFIAPVLEGGTNGIVLPTATVRAVSTSLAARSKVSAEPDSLSKALSFRPRLPELTLRRMAWRTSP
jgi:hypothetical protein